MRDPSSASRLASLDGMRGVSIIMVLGAHATRGFSPQWGVVFNGDLGVRVFFVISGFLITTQLLREKELRTKIDLPLFYLRRLIRLAPVQWAFLITLYILTLTTQLHVSGCQFLTSITYTKNYGCGAWIDGHLWSLSVEEQFYLLWPILVAITGARARFQIAIALIVLAPVFRVIFYVTDLTDLRLFSFMSNMDSLMIGCVAASLHRSGRFVAPSRWRTMSRICALVAMYLVWLGGYLLFGGKLLIPFGPTIQAIAAAFLIISLQREPIGLCHTVLNNPVLVWTGLISYSLYVWQQIFFSEPATFGLVWAPVLVFPANLGAAVAVSVLSYFVLEKSLQSLRSRLHARVACRPSCR